MEIVNTGNIVSFIALIGFFIAGWFAHAAYKRHPDQVAAAEALVKAAGDDAEALIAKARAKLDL